MNQSDKDRIFGLLKTGPIWRLRQPSDAQESAEDTPEIMPQVSLEDTHEDKDISRKTVVASRLAEFPETHVEQPVLVRHDAPKTEHVLEVSGHLQQSTQANGDTTVGNMSFPDLAEAVKVCRACALCEQRHQAVLGAGDMNANADWFFIGEGPGAEEDQQGQPFVGKAGQLLTAMISAMKLDRQHNVYISNLVKCRPPNNRTPNQKELEQCWPYLARQIALVHPKMIVTLGRPAAQMILGREVKIASDRLKVHHYEGISVVVTYHPAYLLRNPPDKAKAWQDLCLALNTMAKLRQCDQ